MLTKPHKQISNDGIINIESLDVSRTGEQQDRLMALCHADVDEVAPLSK
jgi:hypothetical protein